MGASAADVQGRSWQAAAASGISATLLSAGMFLLAGLFYQITPLSIFILAALLLAALGFGGRVVMLSRIYRLGISGAVNVSNCARSINSSGAGRSWPSPR